MIKSDIVACYRKAIKTYREVTRRFSKSSSPEAKAELKREVRDADASFALAEKEYLSSMRANKFKLDPMTWKEEPEAETEDYATMKKITTK
jgi:hypothetical protein